MKIYICRNADGKVTSFFNRPQIVEVDGVPDPAFEGYCEADSEDADVIEFLTRPQPTV